MKAGLRDPSLKALQNGLSAQTRPKSDRQRGRLAVTTSQCVSRHVCVSASPLRDGQIIKLVWCY